MTEPTVALTEMFSAPQGEGYNAGRFAVFIRLSGCNLRCEFVPGVVCDTPYMNKGYSATVTRVLEQAEYWTAAINEALERGGGFSEEQPMLIITGGEPTLQPGFNSLATRAVDRGWYVAVETNGTRWRPALKDVQWLTVSPKNGVEQTSEAQGHSRVKQPNTAVNPQVLLEMRRRANPRLAKWHNEGGEYRYVITPNSDMPNYEPAPRHYVSPAVLSDGSGLEWQQGFPGFVPGAVNRCLSIIRRDPRWRISCQQHKILGVR